jgi:hypothetical protein
MALADLKEAMGGKPMAGKKSPVAVSVKVEPLDLRHAAAELIRAVDAKDLTGVENALRLGYGACRDEEEHDEPDGDEGEEPPDDEPQDEE